MGRAKPELIQCHDCGAPVSFRAVSCPRCGSIEPSGPYVMNRREKRRHRIEARNDRNLMLATIGCTVGGVLFGVLTSSSPLGAVGLGTGYGLLGLLLGVPVGFVINMTRHL
jgi:4-hydroxy-3-methylbut-2-en-1-yl diphosphate synthase IspG/GcpE